MSAPEAPLANDAADMAATLVDQGVQAGNAMDALGALGAGSVFSWSGYFQALAVLSLFIALLWAGVWFLKRRGGIQKLGILTRDLCVENRLSLGPKKMLVVVRFLNKRLLLGVSDQRITLLTELTDDDDDSPNTRIQAQHAAAFTAALRTAEDADAAPDSARDSDGHGKEP